MLQGTSKKYIETQNINNNTILVFGLSGRGLVNFDNLGQFWIILDNLDNFGQF